MTAPVPSDTAPIRPEEGFDEDLVSAYLRDHVSGVSGDVAFDQFPGGAANLTYRAVSGDLELVLRRAPLGEVAVGSHDMAREYQVLSRLWREYSFAPRAFHFCEDSAVMGKPFVVMQRRSGSVIRDRWPNGWDVRTPDPRPLVAVSLVDALAQLHLIDAPSVGLGDLGRPDGFVTRQVEGWRMRWEATQTRRLPAMEQAAVLLEGGKPEPRRSSILHNDYKLDNTMVDDRGRVVAVLDWDMATRGDPLVDLGTLLAYWPDPASPTFPVLGERAVALTPYLTKQGALSRYESATGFDIDHINFYEGLALFRIAVIIEQIYARYVSGATSDARFARFEPVVPVLANAAVAVLDGN